MACAAAHSTQRSIHGTVCALVSVAGRRDRGIDQVRLARSFDVDPCEVWVASVLFDRLHLLGVCDTWGVSLTHLQGSCG